MENAGAVMQRSFRALPEGGLAAITRLMSVASVVSAAVVALYAVLTIALGTIALMAVPLSWSIGEKSLGKPTVNAQMSVVQITAPSPLQKQLDMNCPELKKGGDISKCTWLPHTPTGDEIAVANKAKQTPGNWFNAAIRPVFWSIPVFLLVLGLVEASRCLNGLARGRYFDAGTVTHLRNFAITGLLYVLLTPCMPLAANLFCTVTTSIESVIVKAWAPHQAYTVSMPTYFEAGATVGGIKMFSEFLIGLYAFTLAVIATVMAKASAIVEDHAEII